MIYEIDAWAAGFFDGEGCVVIQRNLPKYRGTVTQLKIGQNDSRPLNLLQENYGGSVSKNKRGNYVWVIAGEKSEEFARKILPYSVVKREQLEHFIEVRTVIRTKRSTHYSAEENARRDGWVTKLKDLRTVEAV